MKNLISEVCQTVLRPLASVFLRCGLTWREFSDISKATFVEVASGEFGKRKRATSVSRVCILTGIHRKEVKRLRDLIAQPATDYSNRTSDATRMLNGWHQDKEFTDQNGHPAVLTLDGPGPSFAQLFTKYGGDTPSQTMLRELKESKSIEVVDDDRVRALARYFMPYALSAQNIQVFGSHLSSHAETLRNNIVEHDNHDPLFDRAAIVHNVDAAYQKAFHEFIGARCQNLLEDVDDWLLAHQVNESDENCVPVKLGLGIYAIESTEK